MTHLAGSEYGEEMYISIHFFAICHHHQRNPISFNQLFVTKKDHDKHSVCFFLCLLNVTRVCSHQIFPKTTFYPAWYKRQDTDMPKHSPADARRTPSFHTPIFQRIDSRKIPFFQRQTSSSPLAHGPRSSFPTTSRPASPNFSTMPTMSAGSSNSELDLNELVMRFKKNVSIKDRRYRLHTYKDVFVGTDAVQWMVTSGLAETRQDAVKIGLMMQEAGIIEHCVRDHE